MPSRAKCSHKSCYNPHDSTSLDGSFFTVIFTGIQEMLNRNLKASSLFVYALVLTALAACTPATPSEPNPTTSSLTMPVELGPTSTVLPEITVTPGIELTPTLQPIPAISNSDHALGDPQAAITLLVYSDFQCPYCKAFFTAWKQIEAIHPGNVQLIFRHFPLLSLHDKADIAGAAAEIAGRSGLFWEMHDYLFEQQDEWKDLSRDAFADWISQGAESLSLDPVAFYEELAAGEALADMTQAYRSGLEAGIPGTPFIFFNGEWYRLNPSAINLEASIQLELLKETQYTEPPPAIFDADALYFAHLILDEGEIVFQLYPELAPATVASFIFLAEEGWYDDIGFHRVLAQRSVETGDPTGTGLGGPGYLLLDELSATLDFDEVGMVAMTSSGPDTNGSRFFINLIPLPQFNGARTIFGRVTQGLELLGSLEDRDPFQDLFEPYKLVIHSIRIETR